MSTVLPLLLITCFANIVTPLDNGVGRKPPLGWMSWERFRCDIDCKKDPRNCVSERLYMDMADMIVREGLTYSGYEYVNLDDCWMSTGRDQNESIIADHDRFPSGIRFLADYMHGRGLKLGVFVDLGPKTCRGFPGSQGYLKKDAQTFADWGVDMVKADACDLNITSMRTAFRQFGKTLNETGRRMHYSCKWPTYEVAAGLTPDYEVIASVCNTWRNYKDIDDSWDSILDIVSYYGNNTGSFLEQTGPGQFNDPDQLIVGNYGLSQDEQKSQMAMWGILGAPLLMSSDLRTLSKADRVIVTDDGVLKANQDMLGLPAQKFKEMGDIEIWTKKMAPAGLSLSYVFLNKATGGSPAIFRWPLTEFGLNNTNGYYVTQHLAGEYGTVFVGQVAATVPLNITINPSGVYFGHAEYQNATIFN